MICQALGSRSGTANAVQCIQQALDLLMRMRSRQGNPQSCGSAGNCRWPNGGHQHPLLAQALAGSKGLFFTADYQRLDRRIRWEEVKAELLRSLAEKEN